MANSTITISGGEVDVFSENISNTDIAIVAGEHTTLILDADEAPTTIVVHDPGPQGPVGNTGPTGPPGTNKADVVLYLQYLLSDAEVVYAYNPSANQTFTNTGSTAFVPNNFTSTYNANLFIWVNNTVIGTIDFPANTTTGICNFPTFTIHGPNADLFQVIAQHPADPSFGMVRVTLSGTRA